MIEERRRGPSAIATQSRMLTVSSVRDLAPTSATGEERRQDPPLEHRPGPSFHQGFPAARECQARQPIGWASGPVRASC